MNLAELLKDHSDEIINSWAQTLKTSRFSSYEVRPLPELKRMCRECLEGCIVFMEKGDYNKIRAFIGKKARIRSAMGFRLSEIQKALYTLKESALLFIRVEYARDINKFDNALIELDKCLIKVIFEFSEIYQQEINSKLNEYVSQIEQFNRRLEHLSITDGLTDLYNHKYFQEMLIKELRRSERYERPLSLVMLDVDNFKLYNDSYGHISGDEILKKIARIFKAETRIIDIACRYGGEEFILILPETDVEKARIVTEKIRSFFTRQTGLTVSAGVAGVTEYPVNPQVLITRVDKALYRAKRSGKDRVYVFCESKNLDQQSLLSPKETDG
ncbi:MAG: diguanylate cyclase [Candidatus Omnitrophota bacterium]|nr:diguanylate cyclase [Candidatus Omnitrophota bacterium]